MSKGPATTRTPLTDLTGFCKSTFTLTFAIELVGLEEWQDIKDENLELGPCVHGVKLQYQLYYGQNFEIDVAIWPQVAKIYCGVETCWVRCWQFLERRWLTFSIRHAFPVRVLDLIHFEVLVNPSAGVGILSSSTKSDKPSTVYIPPLLFGERRYFGPVVEDLSTTNEKLVKFIKELVWSAVVNYIPSSYLDGVFDVPYPVKDIRHQDTILERIQCITLNRDFEPDEEVLPEESVILPRKISKDKSGKDKEKKKGEVKNKFGLRLMGSTILAE